MDWEEIVNPGEVVAPLSRAGMRPDLEVLFDSEFGEDAPALHHLGHAVINNGGRGQLVSGQTMYNLGQALPSLEHIDA